jgi:copper(I)-binding protein
VIHKDLRMPRSPGPAPTFRSLEERLMMLRTFVPCGLTVALLALLGNAIASHHAFPAENATFAVGDLVVENPWARESVTRTGAVYLTVRNGGDQDDRLVGVSSEVADKAELHSSVMQDGVMKMRAVEAVDVPAHGEAVLEPGGLHIMLIGLKAPLEEGKSFALTLEFENAGGIEVMTTIEEIAHAGGGSHDHGHGN